MTPSRISRRHFLGTSALTAAAFAVVPRHVLGGEGKPPPSDTATYATIGNGRRRDSGIGCLGARKKIAVCDVDTKHMEKEKPEVARYKDFRLLLERKDLDAVAIGTPPHWHALPAIAAAQAGKHIFCEKPTTKFIAEGRALADAVARYGVAFQIGTFKRFGNSRNRSHVECHKIIAHGLIKDLSGVCVNAGARNRIGKTNLKPQPVPANLDYDFWLGPAPWKPYNAARVHYNNRFYWDYEGGDLTNFGYHSYDPLQRTFAKDATAPVKARPHAPWPQHPDAVGYYGWVELTYADGLRVIITGGGNDITPVATGSDLVWDLKGGLNTAATKGLKTLTVEVTGDTSGETDSDTVDITVREIGDVTGDLNINAIDKLNFNKRLNGIGTIYPDRAYDLNGDGSVNAIDKLQINQALNGIPIP